LTVQGEPSVRSATAEVEWIATSTSKASSRGTDGGCKSRRERKGESLNLLDDEVASQDVEKRRAENMYNKRTLTRVSALK
jgi:hypothetical protein